MARGPMQLHLLKAGPAHSLRAIATSASFADRRALNLLPRCRPDGADDGSRSLFVSETQPQILSNLIEINQFLVSLRQASHREQGS